MVNVYMSAEEAESRSPYASNPTSPGYSGNNSSYQPPRHGQQSQIPYQQSRPRQQSQVQPQQQLTYQEQAELNAQQRPGFYQLSQLGDMSTQQLRFMTDTQRMVFGQMGIQIADEEKMTGTILEAQRQAAQKTPGTRDDQFYSGELEKWNRRAIEKSSAYHDVGMRAGVPIPANMYENVGDVALAFEKGGNLKDFTADKYGFNKNVGGMLGVLPGGKGLQETAWQVAKTGEPANVDFMPAIEYLSEQRGRYGPYGKLYGGIEDRYDKTPINQTIANRNAGAGGKVAWLPAGVFATGEIGRIEPGKAEEPRALSFGGVIKDFTQSFEQLKKGDILSGIGLYSQGLSRYSTRAVMPSAEGFGEYIDTEQAKSPGPVGTVVAGAAYIGETIYSDIRKDPVQDVALYMLPLGFKAGESFLSRGVAKAATSGYPVISGAGRLFSTPAAKTWGAIAKAGMVGVYAFQSGESIYTAPNTPKGKGEAIGTVGYQVGMMTAGLPLASSYTPKPTTNPFESRTFFTGERKLPASEKIMIRAADFVNSFTQTKGQRVAIRSVSTEYGKNAFTPPEITTVEPNYADLTHVGPSRAAAVKAAMVDQPSVGYGSGIMEAQLGKGEAAMTLRAKALPSSDIDVFAEFPDIMKVKAGKAAVGMDIHTFPEGYPSVGQAANEPVQPGSYLFGNRYRTNPYVDEITLAGKTKGYTGETSFEHLNVQFRKLSSAVRDDVADPMNKGYRLGKDVSRLTRVGDVLEEVKGGSTKGSAYDEMLKQTITYNEQSTPEGKPNIRTDTLENIRARYEGNPKQIIPDTFSKYTKGAVSTIASSIAEGSFVSSLGKSSVPSASSLFSSSRPGSSSPSSSILSFISPVPSGRTPSSPVSPPYTPPIITPIPSRSPPYTPPPSSPTRLTPPTSPPYTPTPSTPPRSPPSSPPSTPPYVPPYTPPYKPPLGGFPSGMGGSGDRPFMNRGEYRWSTLNPVADIPYLSKGLGNPFPSSGGSGGGSLNAKCRHILPKLRKKCSRFLRNG